MTTKITPSNLLAKNLKLLMNRRGLSQSGISGVSQKTISNIWTESHSPSLETIEALSRFFRVSPADLISRDLETGLYGLPVDIIERIQALPTSKLRDLELAISLIEAQSRPEAVLLPMPSKEPKRGS